VTSPPQMLASEADARSFIQEMCDAVAMEKLERFARHIGEENERQNLISARSLNTLWQRHLADSAQLLNHVPRETMDDDGAVWLDLGSGPGLPGLVIAILRPRWSVKLVESRKRRVEFLESCVEDLTLPNCEIFGQRVERLVPFASTVISARAFAPLPSLLKLAKPFSTAATTYVLPKGRSALQELETLGSAQRRLFHVEQSLTDADAGIIVGRTNNSPGRTPC